MHKIRFRYQGGEAEKHRLDLYDGTASMHGLARALSIAVHGYVNHDVIHKATALRGAKLYIRPAQRGSFLNEVWIEITSNPVAVGVAAAAFYDFVKFTFNKAVGYLDELPYTPSVSKLNTEDEPFFDEMAESMEGALLEGHRPIQSDGGTISIERPRSKLLTLNKNTLAWVASREQADESEEIKGNITRYNVLSRNGRLYDYDGGQTYPFRPDPNGISKNTASNLSWSLDQLNNGFPGALKLTVRRTLSANGVTKRYTVIDSRRIVEDEDESGA